MPTLASLRPSTYTPGRVRAALGVRCRTSRGEIDDRALERGHEVAHAEPRAPQVDQRIDHELARAVIGHLPAAIDLHHRDIPAARARARARAFIPSVNTGGCSRNQISSGVSRAALIGEALHGAPGRLVLHAAEPPDRAAAHRVLGACDRDLALIARRQRRARCRGRRCCAAAPARRDSSSAPAGRRRTRRKPRASAHSR